MGTIMTIPEIEQAKGIRSSVLHYWVRNGLRAVKKGRDYFIDLSDLDQFIKERVEVKTIYQLKSREEDLTPEERRVS